MAKIRVFEKTREIDKNIKGLSNKMDKLKTDIDRYFQLMVEAKRKVEEKARLLEEERKREELLVQERKRLEEEKRKEEERRIEEEKRLKAECIGGT
jgi:phage-related minor tail protein